MNEDIARFAKLPIRDWEDLYGENRFAEAVESVSRDRLVLGMTCAIDLMASDAHMPADTARKLVEAGAVWESLDTVELRRIQLAEICGQNNGILAFLATSSAKTVGKMFLEPIVGSTLAEWGTERVTDWGFDQVTQARTHTAVLQLASALTNYEQSAVTALDRLAADATMVAAFATKRREQHRWIMAGVAGSLTIGGILLWFALRNPTESPAMQAQPSAVPVTRAIAPAPPPPRPVDVPAKAKPSKTPVRRSASRAECLKACIAACTDDPVCERACVVEKCR